MSRYKLFLSFKVVTVQKLGRSRMEQCRGTNMVGKDVVMVLKFEKRADAGVRV